MGEVGASCAGCATSAWMRRFFAGLLAIANLGTPLVAGATGFINAASLGSARASHTATLLPSGKVLVAGGGTTSHLASAELYDPAVDAWTPAAPLTAAREGHSATLLPSGRVLVSGGFGNSGNGYLASAEIYDPASNAWTPAASLGSARWQHSATLLASGKVLVVGGAGSGSTYLSSAELYDPVSNTWSPAGTLAVGRYGHTATLLPSGDVLVAGGYNGSILASTELYDHLSNTWHTTAPLDTARQFHSATLLASGKVLVVAGVGNSGEQASASLYDPASDTWAPAGGLSTARHGHGAVMLPTGKVLVAGGIVGSLFFNFTILSSAELYDPQSNTWLPAGALGTARLGHAITLLSNGGVLVTAGHGNSGYLASAELYAPVTNVLIGSTVPATTVAGQAYTVNFSANAGPGTPTGSIVVSDDQGANCGPVVLSAGSGSCSLRSMVAGARVLTASYTPDSGAFAAGSATTTHQVSKAATDVSGFATPNNSAWGQSVVYTAYVSAAAPGNGSPTGNVQISDGISTCTAQVSDGAASCSLVPGVYGNYLITLSYLGDDNFNPGNSLTGGTLGEASTSVMLLPASPSSAVVGQPVVLSSHVNVLWPGVGPATGAVSMSNGQEGCVANVQANEHAACVARFTKAGWYSVHGYYGGQTHQYLPSVSDVVQLNVDPAQTTTAITVQTPVSSAIGESVSFGFSTGAVAPSTSIPVGSVTVSDGSQSCTSALDATGQGSCAIAFASAGTRHVVATYSGSILSYYASSSPSMDHVVNPTGTTLSINAHTPDPSTPSQPVSVTSTLSAAGVGPPTGSVTIGDGVDSCQVVQGGTGCTLTLTTRGARTLTASYAGDGNFSASSAQVVHHVNRLPIVASTTSATSEEVSLTVPAAQGVLAGASDPDGDALTISNTGTLTAAGIGGTVTLSADGSYSYAPPVDANGIATFDYVVSDGHESVTATATITVTAVNDAPSFALAPIADWPAGANGLRTQAGFASVTSFGAANEAGQHVRTWHVRTISDPNGVANSVSIALDGTLSYTLSGHAGSATFGVTLQDDGDTANGGDDTSAEQTFAINVAAGLDLSISIDDATDFAPGGGTVVYAIVVHNAGPNDAIGATVKDLLPANLVDASWICESGVGASCTQSGSADIDDTVTIPGGATLTYVLGAHVLADPESPLVNTVSVIAPANVPDANAANDAATDTDTVGIFADGFDQAEAAAAPIVKRKASR